MVRNQFTYSLITALLAFAGFAGAQGGRMSSPRAKAEVNLKGADVTVDYGRPSVRGRKIMGGLVPYGEVWRTGANEATGFVTTSDLLIGNTPVPAGKYTLYSLPSEGGWKLIVNRQTGQWGTEYDQSQDLARIDMKESKTESPVEQFLISFKKTGADQADLVMDWEHTRVSVVIKAK